MIHSETRARAVLDAWREQDAHRLDPMRFHFIEALERRAATYEGEARQLLDNRLSQLLDAYARDLQKVTPKTADHTAAPCAPTRSALAELTDDIASRAAARSSNIDATALPSALPELEVLHDIRNIWSKVRSESQMRQSLEQVPTNAGPLNSSSLVHRSLTLMRELSPGYLQQFLSYIDALSWIQQMNDGGALITKETPRAASPSKRARKPRARRD